MKLSLTSGHTPRLFRSRSQVGYEASCFWNMASEMFYAGACLLEQGCGLVVHTLLLLLSSLSSRPVFVFFWVSSTVSVARACGNSVASRKPVAPRNGRVLPHLSSRRHELPSSPLSHCFVVVSPPPHRVELNRCRLSPTLQMSVLSRTLFCVFSVVFL